MVTTVGGDLVPMDSDRLDAVDPHQPANTALVDIGITSLTSIVMQGRPLRLPAEQALRINCSAKAQALWQGLAAILKQRELSPLARLTQKTLFADGVDVQIGEDFDDECGHPGDLQNRRGIAGCPVRQHLQ